MDKNFPNVPQPRSADNSALLYMFPQPQSPSLTKVLTPELAAHILEISQVSNTVLLIWGEINFPDVNLLSFSLARALTFELNILREGIKRLNEGQHKKCLDPACHNELAKALERFDHDFGEVKKLRDILAHFEGYCFPRQPIPALKHSEALKLRPTITVDPSAKVSLKNVFIHDTFCSGDRRGILRKIFIGPEFQSNIFSMLSLCLEGLRFNGTGYQFTATHGLLLNEHATRHKQFIHDLRCYEPAQNRTRRRN